MANTPASGIYHPEGTVAADIASILDDVTASIDARVISTFASTSARDAAFSGLTAAQRAGAKVYVSGVGWMGYNASSGSYSTANWVSEDQIKGGRIDSVTAEGNGMHRIPAAQCFFNGVAPSSLKVTPILGWPSPLLYVDVAFGIFDGSGALIHAIDRRTNTAITGAVAFFWQAKR